MKIVMLDQNSIGKDIDLSYYNELGEFTAYGYTPDDLIAQRIREADVIVLNKQNINAATLGPAENLKLVCVTATGINNLDTDFLAERKIAWRNVAGYSTDVVAQHTFALLFYLYEHLPYYDEYVKSEKYVNDSSFTHFSNTFHELSGKTWGIIGMGNIGRKVAEIAQAFGAKVVYYSTSGKNNAAGFKRVSFDELLKVSDIVSVHAPLNEKTKGLMNKEAFSKMKNTAIFINVGRGPIVVEEDLAEALEAGEISGAGLDVLSSEPMSENNPLKRIKDSGKLIITPHIAWAAVESRQRVMRMVYENIAEFFNEADRKDL